MKLLNIRLSSDVSGVQLKNLTNEKAGEICDVLLGVDGIKRMTIEWPQEESTEPQEPLEPLKPPGQPKGIEYPVQDCTIIDHPDAKTTALIEEITDQVEDEQVFTEIDRIPKVKLGNYTDLGDCELGYHTQPNGRVVICCGSTKVYTTWKAIEALPYPTRIDSMKNLSKQKRVAITHIKEWIKQGKPEIYKDPDEIFRQTIIQDTRPKNGGDHENTSGEYD